MAPPEGILPQLPPRGGASADQGQPLQENNSQKRWRKANLISEEGSSDSSESQLIRKNALKKNREHSLWGHACLSGNFVP